MEIDGNAQNFVEVKMEPHDDDDDDDEITPKLTRRNKNISIPIAQRTRRQTLRKNSDVDYSQEIEISKKEMKSETEDSENYDNDDDKDSDYEVLVENCKCLICDEVFTLKTQHDYHWRSHMPTHFPDGPDKPGFFECNQCQMKFSKRYQYGRHMNAHRLNDTEYFEPRISKRCKICHKRFTTETSLAKHMQEATFEHNPVECDICEKIFPTKRRLLAHIRKHDDKLICHICGCSKSDVASMRMHVRRHNKDYGVFCEICSKPFYNKSELRNHMFHRHTDKDENRPFICQYCGRTYRSTGYLKLHVKRVHVDADGYKKKKFKCDLCNFETHLLKCLTVHKQTHTGENLIPCEYCDKLINKRYMIIHVRIHTGEKPFNCAICGKNFNSKKNLVRHQGRTHKPKF